MQCSLCKRWYDYSQPEINDRYSAWGCCTRVSKNGCYIGGGFGSLTMDCSDAEVVNPGTYTAGALMCDYCVLAGMERGDIMQDPNSPDYFDRALPVSELRAKGVRSICYQPGRYVDLLCPLGDSGWLFRAVFDDDWARGKSVRFVSIGYPERSDVVNGESVQGLSGEIMSQPDVVELRALVERYLK